MQVNVSDEFVNIYKLYMQAEGICKGLEELKKEYGWQCSDRTFTAAENLRDHLWNDFSEIDEFIAVQLDNELGL